MAIISIPKPCSEKWGNMKPTTAGAFCLNCRKEVIDFTQNSDEEIVTYVQQHEAGSLCAKMTQHQLSRINFVEWENQSQSIFLSKFVLALFLVFGLCLFSCKSPEVALEKESNTTIPISHLNESTDSNTSHSEPTTNEINTSSLFSQTDSIKKSYLTLSKLFTPTSIDEPVNVYWGNIILGDVAHFPNETPSLAQNELAQSQSLILDYQLPFNELENLMIPMPFEIQELPKVTRPEHMSFNYISNEITQLTITIIDLNGRTNYTVFDQKIENGITKIDCDLTEVCPGFYAICFNHNGRSEIRPLTILEPKREN